MPLIYAGIDEAGYGPLFGPMVIGRAVVAVRDAEPGHKAPDLWKLLNKAVCKTVQKSKGRLPINDSKKLHSQTRGVRHLELSLLALAASIKRRPAHLGDWLEQLGETRCDDLAHLPWYHACDERPWQPIPSAVTEGEVRIAANMFARACEQKGVKLLDLGAAVVFEDQFNDMVAKTRSKAATSFTFVARHLDAVLKRWGRHHPVVAVDRQSGRSHYRQILSQSFPDMMLTELGDTREHSGYELERTGRCPVRMGVHFQTGAEDRHLPVAVASMIAKYTREMLMARFQQWWSLQLPEVKPTAGYGTDGVRFWNEVRPRLPELGIDEARLKRMS